MPPALQETLTTERYKVVTNPIDLNNQNKVVNRVLPSPICVRTCDFPAAAHILKKVDELRVNPRGKGDERLHALLTQYCNIVPNYCCQFCVTDANELRLSLHKLPRNIRAWRIYLGDGETNSDVLAAVRNRENHPVISYAVRPSTDFENFGFFGNIANKILSGDAKISNANVVRFLKRIVGCRKESGRADGRDFGLESKMCDTCNALLDTMLMSLCNRLVLPQCFGADLLMSFDLKNRYHENLLTDHLTAVVQMRFPEISVRKTDGNTITLGDPELHTFLRQMLEVFFIRQIDREGMVLAMCLGKADSDCCLHVLPDDLFTNILKECFVPPIYRRDIDGSSNQE
jgi:hypothetical protein